MAKEKISTDEKFDKQEFDLFTALSAIDKQDWYWFRNLTTEQQRKFSPYMMIHWISSINKNGPLAEGYVLATEQSANKYIFNENVTSHPELQWMMLCASSLGCGPQRHTWLPHLSERYSRYQERPTKKKVSEYFQKIYTADTNTINEAAEQYVTEHNHRHRLAEMYPNMKLEDISMLANCVTAGDINEYEKQCGL